jgi:hypothetical protein
MSDAFTVFYFVLGVSSDPFLVDITKTQTVGHLKNEIGTENPNVLERVAPRS